jgi:hypothetical protein
MYLTRKDSFFPPDGMEHMNVTSDWNPFIDFMLVAKCFICGEPIGKGHAEIVPQNSVIGGRIILCSECKKKHLVVIKIGDETMFALRGAKVDESKDEA